MTATLQTTNIQNATSSTTNLALDTSGNVTVGSSLTAANNITATSGTVVMASSFLRNKIINGGMQIDQRNAGASLTPNNQYTVDRWYFGNSQSGKFTAQQNAGSVTTAAGFPNYLGFTSTSSYTLLSGDQFYLRQAIEGFNTADLAWGTSSAKSVTLSFVVYSSLSGTFGGVIANSAVGYVYPFTYTIPSTNTWTTVSVTIPGPTAGTWVGATNGVGIYVYFNLGTGTSFSGTPGSWQAAGYTSATGATSVVSTNGATFYITGVQLEVGSVATPFERRQYGQELLLCQRYYEKSFDVNTAPASASASAGAFEFAQQVGASTTQYGPSCKYSVAKRAAATVTFYNWNAAGNQAVNISTAGNTTGLTLRSSQSGTTSYSITFTTPSGTSAGQGLSVMWTADAEL